MENKTAPPPHCDLDYGRRLRDERQRGPAARLCHGDTVMD